MWRKVSLSLQGKEIQSGPVGLVMTYEGKEPSGLDRYCRRYSQTVDSTALLTINLQQTAFGNGSSYSYIDTMVYVGNRLSGVNFATVENFTQNFGVSAAITETLPTGTTDFALCVRGSNVTGATTNYSVGLVQ